MSSEMESKHNLQIHFNNPFKLTSEGKLQIWGAANCHLCLSPLSEKPVQDSMGCRGVWRSCINNTCFVYPPHYLSRLGNVWRGPFWEKTSICLMQTCLATASCGMEQGVKINMFNRSLNIDTSLNWFFQHVAFIFI